MLINFTFSNYRSYRDDTNFSMVAGKGRSKKESLIPIPGQRYAKLLPLSAVYGANASGKSTLIKALMQLQKIVKTGRVETEPFRLDTEYLNQPTRFNIAFVAGDRVWEYVLVIKGKTVEEERLSQIDGKKEELVFERTSHGAKIGKVVKEQNGAEAMQEDNKFLQMLIEKIDRETLFLYHARNMQLGILQNILNVVIEWFSSTLCIIEADSHFIPLGYDMFQRSDEYAQALIHADTGIVGIQKTKLDLERLDIPSDLLEQFRQSKEDILFYTGDPAFIVKNKETGGLEAYRCLSEHQGSTGDKVSFLFREESDGTRRLMNLLPIVLEDDSPARVFIIDELDRSLHTQLSKMLIEDHRRLTSEGAKRQIIFTTHDVMLMDQKLLRKDELWVVERDANQGSTLITFDEFFDIRKDKDIRRSYLMGRMGGTPRLSTLL